MNNGEGLAVHLIKWPGPALAPSPSVSKGTDAHLLVTWALCPIPAPLCEPIPREQPREPIEANPGHSAVRRLIRRGAAL